MDAEIVIAGGSAAGLSAAIFAAEAARGAAKPKRIIVLEGASKPGAKILISGGGRCNVTNERVSSADYNGGPQPIIRNVLRAFDEQRTIAWMREVGVDLKLEPTGKYFPVSETARTVLDALHTRARQLGVELRSGTRITNVQISPDSVSPFRLNIQNGDPVDASRVIMATGGLALPKSGSDGAGLNWMRQLGHTLTPTSPALVPLVLQQSNKPGVAGNFAEYAGVTLNARLTMVSETGKHLHQVSGSTLITHFGLSGPAPLDISRHIAQHMLQHPEPVRILLGHPDLPNAQDADKWLQSQVSEAPRRLVSTALTALYADRIAVALANAPGQSLKDLTRAARLELAQRIAGLPLTVTGNRGYSFAETNAGGVDLREIDARTMQSRRVPGMFLCGEMLDVDGRIGGFNFQWAWASGYLAGRGAVQSLLH